MYLVQEEQAPMRQKPAELLFVFEVKSDHLQQKLLNTHR